MLEYAEGEATHRVHTSLADFVIEAVGKPLHYPVMAVHQMNVCVIYCLLERVNYMYM